MLDYQRQRDAMVDLQIAGRGIADQHVLDAMRRVPREAFVPSAAHEFAYEDSPLAIEAGQTISQPYIVAAMVEMAGIKPGDRVLEVGAGSGYAAAVIGQIAGEVYAIERHAELAESAQQRIDALGYANVIIRSGDGTRGCKDHAPFDAIVVSAGGPSVPEALKQQLEIGGRLVIPVGTGQQRLVKVTRNGIDNFVTEQMQPVNFVPLIGEHGWPGHDGQQLPPPPAVTRSAPDLIAKAAEPLPALDDPAFGALFDRWGSKRIVMLGEASHGTHEFYAARAAITRRLVEEHGFTIVAVEADWPDAARVDRYVRHRPLARDPAAPFERFPTWMWRNRDMLGLFQWLRTHNEGVSDPKRRAGFYGLDLYNMRGSIAAVLDYLGQVDPEAAQVARERYACLTPWQHDPAVYGRAVLSPGYETCEKAVIAQCRELLEKSLKDGTRDGDDLLDAVQNARLVASAERYYRIMYYGGAESWNLRDSHMFETLDALLEAKGPDAKAVVWAHNSHIGDARHTEMGFVRGEHNIGQLAREKFGDEVALIGFGTDRGTVAAATDWDGPMEIKQVRPSIGGSYERLYRDSEGGRLLLDFGRPENAELVKQLGEPRLERFIGVIYRPETERMSHYMQAILPEQFDAYVWFEESSAVEALGEEHHPERVPDTYPFGT